eukprot:CAMPEP_0201690490 /NCGR_PEP_ID=MMETSP0578-20130828/3927_1 /ASSEMBLY_ACC=CAM_ASM_000663 /TAXON_ID=267565 /ORGANISM="Skeletonema grethea, Strain CCMP 1804" /LENGTH=862 /DNA_ID=CAMNT_0048175503 /DNA_START=34 /DNA_END=2622 /DNA_ORIENTATION=-
MTTATSNRRRPYSSSFPGGKEDGRQVDSISQSTNVEQSHHTIEFAHPISDTRHDESEYATNPPLSSPLHTNALSNTISAKKMDKRFQTKLALRLTACSVVMLALLAACFSEWSAQDFYSASSQIMEVGHSMNNHYKNHDTYLDQNEFAALLSSRGVRRLDDENQNNNNEENGNEGDYSADRCDEIFTKTTNEKSSNSEPSQRCLYARTCDEGDGLLLPFVFCHTSILSTTAWVIVLSPILLLGLAVVFRLLGSTAEEYFSPSLEMFSFKLGLPPRFAGVTLLALGNGAADVSATMNAIASDPENGYKMSLGELTGAAMFITTVVAGAVIMANDGLTCRGALVRDVMALGIATLVVALNLLRGEVTKSTTRTFIGMYIIFVLIVLIADVYHRAVMLPRLTKQAEMIEQQRQLDAERLASEVAGDELNLTASVSMDGDDHRDRGDLDDARTHASAPSQLEDIPAGCAPGGGGNKALTAVLNALSNYSKDEQIIEGFDTMAHQASSGWGVESSVEGTKEWDRPIVLRGPNGILTRNRNQGDGTNNDDNFDSPYHVMEDLDIETNVCIETGSTGFSAHNWQGALQDGKQELISHFRECWRDILDDDESNQLEKFLLICEFPMTICRKLTVSIPCEGSYCRALVALSLVLSPLWVGVYAWNNFDTNIWGWQMGVFMSIALPLGLMLLRYAPGGEGTMATFLAVPIALYGFIIAATWIDAIADKLVALLEFLGVTMRIPNSIMGLTILAWGNSMADLSANVTMARKGLANMAITACFAGPLFNILIGLGAGFGLLRNIKKADVLYVSLTPDISTGFVFCFVNCILILFSGLAVNNGVIPAGYGYMAIGLYVVYIVTSLVLNYALPETT